FWPAGMKHFVQVQGETVIQLHGVGPWQIVYVNPADDPRQASGAPLSGSKPVETAESRTRPARPQATSAALERLFREDQADRTPPEGKGIDWSVVGPRDSARKARVEALYRQNALGTGRDYYLAAMILQHGDRPEDALLAHEFCVAALSK